MSNQSALREGPAFRRIVTMTSAYQLSFVEGRSRRPLGNSRRYVNTEGIILEKLQPYKAQRGDGPCGADRSSRAREW
jgi:hypothetical protein